MEIKSRTTAQSRTVQKPTRTRTGSSITPLMLTTLRKFTNATSAANCTRRRAVSTSISRRTLNLLEQYRRTVLAAENCTHQRPRGRQSQSPQRQANLRILNQKRKLITEPRSSNRFNKLSFHHNHNPLSPPS